MQALRKSTIFLAGVALGFFVLLDVASAHHILGIPHYKYGEDYPQIPYAEVLAQTGNYDIYFTWFPGTPKPKEAVRFKLYAVNRVTQEPFRDPMTVTFVEQRFWGADRVLHERQIATGTGPEGNDYKFYYTFEAPESYRVRVQFPGNDAGAVEIIPFPVVIGETDDRPLFALAVLIVAGTAVLAGVGKRRRERQKRHARRGVRRSTGTKSREEAAA